MRVPVPVGGGKDLGTGVPVSAGGGARTWGRESQCQLGAGLSVHTEVRELVVGSLSHTGRGYRREGGTQATGVHTQGWSREPLGSAPAV